MKRHCFSVLLSILAIIADAGIARAQESMDADVVVLDDTSASMRNNDPQNAIVLVTRLFGDIVPGKLSAVRLFDIGREGDKIGKKDTGKSSPCPDDPSRTCNIFSVPAETLEKVVGQHMLLIKRGARGDMAFKASLPDLLRPSAMDTEYEYSFASVQRVFDENADGPDTERVVVWLSDGAPDAGDWENAKPRLRDLLSKGVAVRALIFASGKTQRVSELGIQPNLVNGTPSELMKAFADVFRQIVGAPFSEDGVVSAKPTFSIKPRMEDVWIVIYGDESLSSAAVSGKGRAVQAEYAADHYNGSAYRVAFIKNPPEGTWTVNATGGGSNVSYAVIQRSTLKPFVYPVTNIFTGVPFDLSASLRSGQGGGDLLPSELPEPVAMDAVVDGQTIHLNNNGRDGRYTNQLTAHRAGPMEITIRAHNSFLDRKVKITVEARGYFRYTGGPVVLDYGNLKAGQSVCRDLSIQAEQEGAVPFELRPIASLPAHLTLELRGGGKRSGLGAAPIPMLAQDQKQICLISDRQAASSISHQQPWAYLAVNGRQQPDSQVELRLTWSVRGLTFWEKWGWLILLILGILLVWFLIYGYIKPNRFPTGLSLCYAPAVDELDDQTPQPIRLWKGVGIGWYRDARACLRDDFRINGQLRGASAILQAGPRKAVFARGGSRPLFREIGVDEWEQMPPNGRRASLGEIYRIGESGPYFRLSTRMGG